MNNKTSKAELLSISDAIENAPYVVAMVEGPRLGLSASSDDQIEPTVRLAASCRDDDFMINRVNRRPVNEN